MRSRFSYRFSQSGLMTRVQRARPIRFFNPIPPSFFVFLFSSRYNTLINFMCNASRVFRINLSLSLFHIYSFFFSLSPSFFFSFILFLIGDVAVIANKKRTEITGRREVCSFFFPNLTPIYSQRDKRIA